MRWESHSITHFRRTEGGQEVGAALGVGAELLDILAELLHMKRRAAGMSHRCVFRAHLKAAPDEAGGRGDTLNRRKAEAKAVTDGEEAVQGLVGPSEISHLTKSSTR